MPTQAEKAHNFRALHHRDHAFILPNPFDAGTARLLAHLGFEALATTSAGYAFTLGLPDNAVARDAMMTHIAAIASSAPLPVSGDLGNGFGDDPETVAETILLAAAAGLVGGSIEDATGNPAQPIYNKTLAVERVRAAAEAARSLPFPFTLTARAENFLHGRPDLSDTIDRLQAFQDAGADVLYAPGLSTAQEIATIVSSVDRPVNVLMGSPTLRLSINQLSALGVRRVSVGGALARAALGAFLRAANEMQQQGTFNFGVDAVSYRELMDIFQR
jgi:2-methylisocitrate lyase-like PEP mutase family enzyme